jgi:hypothetical protein
MATPRSRNDEESTMNQLRFARAARGLIAALLAGLLGSAAAAPDAHYYDGSERRAITRQPDLAAQFAPRNGRTTVQSLPGAVAVPGVGDSLTRVYRLPKTALSSPSRASAGSPVYREGDSPAGRLMALPGGVLVKFKPEWTRARIDAWIAARGWTVGRKLAMAGNWYLVDTAPGDAALTAANAIFESGEVLAASPNWWKQTVPR